MKISWGKGIVIAILLFMGFILFFVFSVQLDQKYDHEMVYDEYYKVDATYDQYIQKIKNANTLSSLPEIVKSADTLYIQFPKNYNNFKGKVSFYRPSDKNLDFEKPFSQLDYSLLIPKDELAGGRWDIVVAWEMNGKDYIFKKVMYL